MDLLLVCLSSQVYVASLMRQPDSQYVSEAVVDKHTKQFIDNFFGGFAGLTAVDKDRLLRLHQRFRFWCFWEAERKAMQDRGF